MAILPGVVAFSLAACSANAPTAAGTVAYIPNYQGAGEAVAGPPVQGYPQPDPR